jgi:hypothetical protein
MMMVRCNALSALVDEESATAASASASVTNMPIPMVRCNAMSWTDEEEGWLRVLVTRRELVTGAVTVMEEQTVPRAIFTGTVGGPSPRSASWSGSGARSCGRRCRAWTARAVERAAKHRCKKDERQTEALSWRASQALHWPRTSCTTRSKPYGRQWVDNLRVYDSEYACMVGVAVRTRDVRV